MNEIDRAGRRELVVVLVEVDCHDLLEDGRVRGDLPLDSGDGAFRIAESSAGGLRYVIGAAVVQIGGEDLGPVAPAGPDLDHRIGRLNAKELQLLERMAQRITLDEIRMALGTRNRPF